MCKDKLNTAVTYMEKNSDKPLALVMWQLMGMGYTMYQIRKAYYVWVNGEEND